MFTQKFTKAAWWPRWKEWCDTHSRHSHIHRTVRVKMGRLGYNNLLISKTRLFPISFLASEDIKKPVYRSFSSSPFFCFLFFLFKQNITSECVHTRIKLKTVLPIPMIFLYPSIFSYIRVHATFSLIGWQIHTALTHTNTSLSVTHTHTFTNRTPCSGNPKRVVY